MESLFHFLFPLIAAGAARVHVKHGVPTLILVALAAVFIDIDHFIGVTRATLHNLFVTLLLPVVLIILAFKYGKEYHRQVSIILLLFLFSHPIVDLFVEGEVALLYPLSTQGFAIGFTVVEPFAGYTLISSSSIGLLIYFGIILLCLFLEKIDYFILKKHEGLKKAARDAFSKEKREVMEEF